MNFLEERITKDGIVKEGNVLKVDSFLNHQMDIRLFDQIGTKKDGMADEKMRSSRRDLREQRSTRSLL